MEGAESQRIENERANMAQSISDSGSLGALRKQEGQQRKEASNKEEIVLFFLSFLLRHLSVGVDFL